ncbi:MAG TPA: SigE family RNA polymerase sigma factor [Acidimicrobiales bacterium]|nr:SigE family RNA polymerase sigma factor [Acidimicrobiales bacterium]
MAATDEFGELYEASRERLAGQLYALTGDEHGAVDLVQEAFARTWAKWDRIANYDDPEAFVRRVAFNLAKNQWRRVRRTLLRGSPPDREQAASDPSDHQALVDALLTLSIHEREAIVLHYLAGEPIEEIAGDLGVPAGTVKSWLARGRAHLAERLSVEDPEEMTRRG